MDILINKTSVDIRRKMVEVVSLLPVIAIEANFSNIDTGFGLIMISSIVSKAFFIIADNRLNKTKNGQSIESVPDEVYTEAVAVYKEYLDYKQLIALDFANNHDYKSELVETVSLALKSLNIPFECEEVKCQK